MRLKNFKATNVHGYLNFDFPFHERLTFLIGINGTGKTSVLKLILGLISPSFNYLNSIDFESAELVCTNGEDNVLITAFKQSDSELFLQLTINGQIIEGKLPKSNFLNSDPEFIPEEIHEKQRAIIELFNQQEIVKEIKKLTTPLFLGLDRRVYEGQQIDKQRQMYAYKRRYRSFPQNDPLNVSLIDIQEVIFDYVRLIASQQPKINEEFKNKILLQSFEFLDNQEINIVKDFKELKEKRKKALDAFENLKIGGFSDHVNKFFDLLEEVLKNIKVNTSSEHTSGKTANIKFGDEYISLEPANIVSIQKWYSNQPQLKRINELIDYNQAYQQEIENLYRPIEQTKAIINKFFLESKKELLIDSQGELSVKFENGKDARIYELSSGEKQIVTMLGHLIFFEEKYYKEPGIFIIDEPELSLHLAWQEIFVNSILEASPKTQFILATHAPAIVGEYSAELCEDLAKLN